MYGIGGLIGIFFYYLEKLNLFLIKILNLLIIFLKVGIPS
jgi:hypothetical protein